MQTASSFFIMALLMIVAACTTPMERADNLIQNAGWEWRLFSTDKFDIATAAPPHSVGQTLWIYIEGDGNAYLTPTRPSSDPTPKDPVGLRLALEHPHPEDAVAYLARPCQYAAHSYKNMCTKNYWTNDRYSPEIITSTNLVINSLKTEAQAQNIVLVGYSGGGALAVLIAAQRPDVSRLITVVADLDTSYWTQNNGLSPLDGSINPASVASNLGNIPQVHFTGQDDTTVGTDVAKSFLLKLPKNTPVRLIEEPHFDHYCCWVDIWPELANQARIQFQDKQAQELKGLY